MYEETPIASLKKDKVEIKVVAIKDWADEFPIQLAYHPTIWESFVRVFIGYTHVRCWLEATEEELEKFTTDLSKKHKEAESAKGLYFYTKIDGPKVHLFPCACCDFGHNIFIITEPHRDDVEGNKNAMGDPEYQLSMNGRCFVPFKDRLFSFLKNEPVVTYEILLQPSQAGKLVSVLNERPTKPSAD